MEQPSAYQQELSSRERITVRIQDYRKGPVSLTATDQTEAALSMVPIATPHNTTPNECNTTANYLRRHGTLYYSTLQYYTAQCGSKQGPVADSGEQSNEPPDSERQETFLRAGLLSASQEAP